MELIAFLAIVAIAYLVFLAVKFSSFKSKLMNEFGRQGVTFADADNLYFLWRDDINNWHHSGVHISEIVQRCLSQSIDDEPPRRSPRSRQHAQASSSVVPARQEEVPDQDDKSSAIIKFVSGTLGIQQALMLMGDQNLPEKAWDNWSLGYVAGTADAVLQKNGIDTDAEGIALMTVIFMEVFGQEAGSALFGDFMRLQDSGDLEVEKGMVTGGGEMFAWMADSEKTPAGWAAHVHGI